MVDIAAIENLMQYLSEDEKKEMDALLTSGSRIWEPLPGPQFQAFYSEADILGYGGAAGGGKSDMICGLALTRHKRSLIIRREKAQTEGIVQRMTDILGNTTGYNSQKSIWRYEDKLIEFGGLDNNGDERRWQGRAHDLKAFDEVTEQREHQVRFAMGWSRTSDAKDKTRIVMTFNPPTSAEGQWVIKFFGPWLDDKHPHPAEPGELRWFTTVGDNEDFEVEGPEPFVLGEGNELIYDFDPADYSPEEIITPLSRTFIPAKVVDNPYYMKSGYIRTLQALPEPLRSQMLNGDFRAGIEDDPWQVIPTAWVDAAMERWEPPKKKPPMDSMGVDVARGGKDNTIIARRHEGLWFDTPLVYPGTETPEGDITAGLVVSARRDQAPVHVDVVGWGSEVYAHLKNSEVQVIPINAGEKSVGRSKGSDIAFYDLNSEMHWHMREALDPVNDTGIALPPDRQLRADLCARLWRLRSGKIAVETKDEVKERIGRSPDWGDSYNLALIDTIKKAAMAAHYSGQAKQRRAYNPYERERRG